MPSCQLASKLHKGVGARTRSRGRHACWHAHMPAYVRDSQGRCPPAPDAGEGTVYARQPPAPPQAGMPACPLAAGLHKGTRWDFPHAGSTKAPHQ